MSTTPVRVEGVPSLMRRLENVSDPHRILRALQTESVVQAKHRVPHKTGNLGRSIHAGYVTGRDALVIASAAYAAPVEMGTKPHVIRGRAGKVLRFPNTRGGAQVTLSGRVRTGSVTALGKGAFVFRRVVRHPGTKAQPYLVPGAQAAVADSGKDIVVGLWNQGG